MTSSNNPKSKKIRTLTEQPSANLSRKRSEQKCKIETKFFDEKNTKKDKPRVFSHSPDKFPNKINEKQKLNKPKTLQHKTLTDRRFTPLVKNENLKSPSNLKVPKENVLKNNKVENVPKKSNEKKVEEKKNEEIKENKENKENVNPQEKALSIYRKNKNDPKANPKTKDEKNEFKKIVEGFLLDIKPEEDKGEIY